MHRFITRFAPSPTGRLHLGHAFSALTAWDAVQTARGVFLLRLEDIDQTRCRPEFEAAIYDDLAWLGISWPHPALKQSAHLNDYAAALDRLRAKGLVYRCFKTRKEIMDDIARAPHLAPEGPDGPAYIGAVLSAVEERALLAKGAPFAWRLSLARALDHLGDDVDTLMWREQTSSGEITHPCRPQMFGDVVLGRKDSGTSYHLASVWDDARQGITHVIRGEDLRAAAHLHTLLQALLALPQPVYRHHRLILAPDGARLAKRDQSETLHHLRTTGVTPGEIRRRLALDPAT